MKLLGTIQNCEIIEDDTGRVFFTADADVDCDGLGSNPHHDPYFQNDTFLHHNGHALTAEVTPFVVVPPLIVRGTKGVVMGCRAKVTNTRNGKWTWAVVADLGPSRKIGELSVEAAERLGLSGNPNTGGTGEHVILYELWPGVEATVDGITYQLQHAA